jgi:hypothetical protein
VVLDKKLKICPEMSGYELSENVFKNSVLYVVCSPNGNVKRPATSFSEKDEIVFHFIG